MVNRSGIWAYSASVAGARHLRRGVERQDRAFQRVEADFAIAVVSTAPARPETRPWAPR